MEDNKKKRTLPSIFGTPLAREYIQNNPTTQNMIDYIADKLIEYARSDDALFLLDFLRQMNIPKRTFFNWIKEYPALKEAYEVARQYMGVNRMVGAIRKRFDKGAILHSQWRFGEEWLRDAEFHRKNDDKQQGDITVVIGKDEKTDIVPERKD